jgi:hypothetical protein
MPPHLPLSSRIRIAARAIASIFDRGDAQAQKMLAGVLSGRAFPPPRGTKQFLEAYSTMPWLRAVTERVANLCSSVTWRLYVPTSNAGPKTATLRGLAEYRSLSRGGQDIAIRKKQVQRATESQRRKGLQHLADSGNLREITEHPMLDLLQGSNSYLTGQSIRKMLHIHLDTVGNALWLKQRNIQGKPDGVWPIPPHWIVQHPTPFDRTFKVSFSGWNADIPETDILWFNDPDPANPYGWGTGLGRALADELDTDEAAAKHLSAFFYNRGHPDLLISGDGVNADVIRQLEDAWLGAIRQRAGMNKKPLFVDHEIKVQEIGQTFEQMQLIPLRQYERDTIIQVFGIPPEIMGILEHSNRSTIDVATYIMARICAVPRLEFIREVLQERLAPEYDERLIVDYDSPVQEDKEFYLKVLQAFPAIAKVNEVRELAGREPLPEKDGDLHLVTLGASAVRSLSELEDKAPAADPILPPVADPNAAPADDTPPEDQAA